MHLAGRCPPSPHCEKHTTLGAPWTGMGGMCSGVSHGITKLSPFSLLLEQMMVNRTTEVHTVKSGLHVRCVHPIAACRLVTSGPRPLPVSSIVSACMACPSLRCSLARLSPCAAFWRPRCVSARLTRRHVSVRHTFMNVHVWLPAVLLMSPPFLGSIKAKSASVSFVVPPDRQLSSNHSLKRASKCDERFRSSICTPDKGSQQRIV